MLAAFILHTVYTFGVQSKTALKGRKFDSIEAHNDWLRHWEQRWASRRIHGRAKRQVEEMFQEEKIPRIC